MNSNEAGRKKHGMNQGEVFNVWRGRDFYGAEVWVQGTRFGFRVSVAWSDEITSKQTSEHISI